MTLIGLVKKLMRNETIIIQEATGCDIYEGVVADFLETVRGEDFGDVENLIAGEVDIAFINNGKLVIVLA